MKFSVFYLLILLSPFNILAQDEVYRIVKEMPTAASCKNVEHKAIHRLCLISEIQKFIYGHEYYQEMPRVNWMQVMQFVVNEDGRLDKIESVHSVNSEVDELLEKIISDMSDSSFWQGGKHDGKAVKVLFTLPIRIEDNERDGIYPEPTLGDYESDDDFLEALGVPVTINWEAFDWEFLEDYERCDTSFDLKDWLWSDSDYITINIGCE